jgi:hypothetical protein
MWNKIFIVMDDVDLNGEVFYKPEEKENLSFNGKKE